MSTQCDWLILCERAYLDENGNQCLAGVFDRSRPRPGEMDVNLANRAAVAFLRGEPSEEVSVSLDLYNPDGQRLVAMPTGPLRLHAEWGTGIVNWTLMQFRLAVGSYEFRLKTGDMTIAVAPLEIFAPRD